VSGAGKATTEKKGKRIIGAKPTIGKKIEGYKESEGAVRVTDLRRGSGDEWLL